MRLSEFQRQYSLHDSPINNLLYFPDQGKLTLEVDVCNDGQWPLIASHLDPLPISLAFTDVSHYSISPNLLDFDNDEINNERILPSKKPGKEIIEFCIFTTSVQGMNAVKFLQIEASNVEIVFR